MDEFEIDDSLDASFSDDSSLDSFELSGDAFDAMDSAEVPTIEDTSFDSIESGNIEDYSYEDTELFNDEVNDVMNGVEVEELTFDDESIEDTSTVEVLETEIDQLIAESAPDLIETMDHVEPEVLEFDDQVEEPYEATWDSEIEILQEDGTVEALENIQNQEEDNFVESVEITEDNIQTEEIQEQLDSHEALSNMSEYMNAHNYGMEDYETYSKDPEWQALNRDLQVANGIEPTEQISEEMQGASSEVILREFDDFEQSVLEYNPEFYETGSYFKQGVNEFGYQGTCGPTSQANAINQLLGTNELTENKVLSVAIDNNLCQTHGALDSCGGTSTEQFMELYDKMNEQLGDKFNTELFEYDNVLDANQVAERLENGDVINVAVDACALWDQPRDYTNAFGVRQDDFDSDHWITVTGVERMEDGGIQGFDIIDSGGGESYVSLDKYNDMCFGTDEHRVIDPTCIVLSRKDELEQHGFSTATENVNSFPDNDMNIEINKRPSLFDRIFHRKGE